jgi:Na+/melibiose symporter-like transporter
LNYCVSVPRLLFIWRQCFMSATSAHNLSLMITRSEEVFPIWLRVVTNSAAKWRNTWKPHLSMTHHSHPFINLHGVNLCSLINKMQTFCGIGIYFFK